MKLISKNIMLVAVALMFSAAHAQDTYPSRPIKLVVPNAAGGGMDSVGRTIALKLSAVIGQPVIVDNRPGAAENIGIDAVAKAQPDGYTLLLSSNSITINPSLFKTLPYNVQKDFVPLGKITSLPLLIVSNASAPFSNLAELQAYAKTNPGRLSYGSPGSGTPHHLAMELYKNAAGIHILHIPYKGTAPGVTDLLGGNISLLVSTVSPVQSHIQSGKLRALATLEEKRLAQYSDVPTVNEKLPGTKVGIWHGVFAPAGTPVAITQKLVGALDKIAVDPTFIKQLGDMGILVARTPPAEVMPSIAQEQAQWARAIKSAGVKAE